MTQRTEHPTLRKAVVAGSPKIPDLALQTWNCVLYSFDVSDYSIYYGNEIATYHECYSASDVDGVYVSYYAKGTSTYRGCRLVNDPVAELLDHYKSVA